MVLLRTTKVGRDLSPWFYGVKFLWVKLTLSVPVPSPFLSPALLCPSIAHFCWSSIFKESWKRCIFKEQLTGSQRGLTHTSASTTVRAATQAWQQACGVRNLKTISLLNILHSEAVATAAGTSEGIKTCSWGQRLQVSLYILARVLKQLL